MVVCIWWTPGLIVGWVTSCSEISPSSPQYLTCTKATEKKYHGSPTLHVHHADTLPIPQTFLNLLNHPILFTSVTFYMGSLTDPVHETLWLKRTQDNE
jgi:hypothetical protein